MKISRSLLVAALLLSSALPLSAQQRGFAFGQITVAATATLVATARPNRMRITIVNDATTDVFCGDSGVTTTTGLLLAGTKGQSLTLDTAAAVYCIVASATEAVSFAEVF